MKLKSNSRSVGFPSVRLLFNCNRNKALAVIAGTRPRLTRRENLEVARQIAVGA